MNHPDFSFRVVSALLLVSLSANVVFGVIIFKYVRKNAYLLEMNDVLVENARIRKTISDQSKMIDEYQSKLNVVDYIDSERTQSND